MRAGDLKRKITLQTPAQEQDSFGQPALGWSDFATVRASVEPLQGREFMAAAQMTAELTTRFRIRYLAGVTEDMRVLYAGRIYNIQSVIDTDDAHSELQLMAVAVS